MKALVIGGTGPTGPHVLHGLMERGYEPAILHRGVHEPEGLPDVRHIHGDPFFRETIAAAIGDEKFDVVLCMYGRVRYIAEALRGRCEQIVAVGGIPAYLNCVEPDRYRPFGMAIPARESGLLADHRGTPPAFSRLVLDAEEALFAASEAGEYRASVVRYPCIYGPRNVIPSEWSVIKRVQDGRPYMILPDGGLGIFCRCAARNAAEVLLLAVDNPETANGEAYNCADLDQFTWRQWVETIVDLLGAELEVVSLPGEIAGATISELVSMSDMAPHTLLDTTKAREQLGYREVVSAGDAIAESVEHLVRQPVRMSDHPAYQDQFDYEAEDRLVAAYRRAMETVVAEAGRPALDLFHGLPHPKKPTVGRDERGR